MPVSFPVQRAMKVDFPEPVIPMTGMIISPALLELLDTVKLYYTAFAYLMILLGEFEVAMLCKCLLYERTFPTILSLSRYV